MEGRAVSLGPMTLVWADAIADAPRDGIGPRAKIYRCTSLYLAVWLWAILFCFLSLHFTSLGSQE